MYYQQFQPAHSKFDPYLLSTLASIHSHKPDRNIWTESRTLTSLSMNGIPSLSYRRCGAHTTETNLNPVTGCWQVQLCHASPAKNISPDDYSVKMSLVVREPESNSSSTARRVSSPFNSPSHQNFRALTG